MGDVLRRAERFEARDDAKEYQFAGTYSFARGLFLAERKLGASFGLPKIQVLRKSDFVYCKIMAWEGAFGLVPSGLDGTYLSGAFVAYEIDRKELEPRFLDYYFKRPAHWQDIGRQSTGTNVRRQSLHPSQFETAEIRLPPLDEQRRIVARIDAIAGKVDEARRLRGETEQEAAFVVASLTTRIFDKLLRGHIAPIRSLGPGGINPIQIGPFGAQLHSSEFTPSGVPVLNVGNVWPQGIRTDRVSYVSREKATRLSRYAVQTGDLLFARSGATLGKVCLVPEECNGWLMSGHLFRVRFDRSRISNRFAFISLRDARQVQDRLFGQVRGATRPGYNTTLLGNIEIPVPPIEIQQHIVEEVDAMQDELNRLTDEHRQTSKAMAALVPAVLDRAFSGGI